MRSTGWTSPSRSRTRQLAPNDARPPCNASAGTPETERSAPRLHYSRPRHRSRAPDARGRGPLLRARRGFAQESPPPARPASGPSLPASLSIQEPQEDASPFAPLGIRPTSSSSSRQRGLSVASEVVTPSKRVGRSDQSGTSLQLSRASDGGREEPARHARRRAVRPDRGTEGKARRGNAARQHVATLHQQQPTSEQLAGALSRPS